MGEFRERRFGELTVRIDRQTCIASENCVNLAPDVFELGDDHIVDFVGDRAPEIDRDRLIEACELCPVDALIVIDEDGNPVVP